MVSFPIIHKHTQVFFHQVHEVSSSKYMYVEAKRYCNLFVYFIFFVDFIYTRMRWSGSSFLRPGTTSESRLSLSRLLKIWRLPRHLGSWHALSDYVHDSSTLTFIPLQNHDCFKPHFFISSLFSPLITMMSLIGQDDGSRGRRGGGGCSGCCSAGLLLCDDAGWKCWFSRLRDIREFLRLPTRVRSDVFSCWGIVESPIYVCFPQLRGLSPTISVDLESQWASSSDIIHPLCAPRFRSSRVCIALAGLLPASRVSLGPTSTA